MQDVINKHVKTSHLILVDKKIAWKLMLDVVILGDIDYHEIDYLSYAIRMSLENCLLPEIKINFNNISGDYNIEILEKVNKVFDHISLPHIFCFGKVCDFYYFGMNYREFQSVDACFLTVSNHEGKILEFEKIGNLFFYLHFRRKRNRIG